MSQQKVLSHLESLLNKMGNNIHIVATGNTVNSEIPADLSIEINPITILNTFNELLIPKPGPQSESDFGTETYTINRIRLSTSIIDDYSKKIPYSDEELLNVIMHKELLFGYY
jgi:hypothetical protein